MLEGGIESGGDVRLGFVLTDEAVQVLNEAVECLPVSESVERAYIKGLPRRILKGDLGIYTLSQQGRIVGILCHRLVDGDAELVYGIILPDQDLAGKFLRMVVDDFLSLGIHTVRSGFSWPGASDFIDAATFMGFIMTDRIGMVRYATGIEPSVGPCRGFELVPWSDEYIDDVCRLMCANSAPEDLHVYPALTTPYGARQLMHSVRRDKHGKFLPELSLVAKVNGRVTGFLISTMLPDGAVLVLDIAVDREYRRKGIGSAIMRWLLSESTAKGKDQVVLAVTSLNKDAVRLYESLGFKKNMTFKQYVLSRY